MPHAISPRPAPGADPGPGHLLVRRVFLTWLGVVCLLAFASLWVQLDGLMGTRGILPAAEVIERTRERHGAAGVWRVPSLCWIACSDAALHALCAAGCALAALLAAGVAPAATLAGLWLLYLSLVSVGGVFLSYQWDSLLLETTFLAALLAPRQLRPRDAWRTPVPRAALLLLRWLLFRLYFMSGAAKLVSGDPTWRDLTALALHYETQPLPAWTSWAAHHLPDALHRASAGAMFAIELGAPFLIFGPRRLRLAAGGAMATLQLLILATGNYGFFNLLALGLCLLLLDDAALRRLVPPRWRARLPTARAAPRAAPTAARAIFAGVASLVVALTLIQLAQQLGAAPDAPGLLRAVQARIAPFRTFNGYGLFAVMTRRRPEIVLEGSLDGRAWVAYELPYKPGAPERRPRFAQPHQPRLDWQLWFAALRGCAGAPWFVHFGRRLLEGSAPVRKLLARDPFPDAPPRLLRSTLYDYRFTSAAELRRTGGWWKRRRLGPYCPVMALPPPQRAR